MSGVTDEDVVVLAALVFECDHAERCKDYRACVREHIGAIVARETAALRARVAELEATLATERAAAVRLVQTLPIVPDEDDRDPRCAEYHEAVFRSEVCGVKVEGP